MEKLIESLPTERQNGKDPEGNPTYSSLCLRYSYSQKMWIAGYGRNQKIDSPFAGSGYSVVEALDDLKTKLNAAKGN